MVELLSQSKSINKSLELLYPFHSKLKEEYFQIKNIRTLRAIFLILLKLSFFQSLDQKSNMEQEMRLKKS